MRKTKEFELFGIKYENKQLSAVEAFEIIDYLNYVQPLQVLKYCSVVKYDGTKVELSSEDAINKEIKDSLNKLPARTVLKAVLETVLDHNFGFLKEWKGVKVPSRFLSTSKTEKSTYMEPIIAQLIVEKVASQKELEDYYSLFDAFSMFDALLVKTVNEAYAHEAAEAEAKSARR